MAGTAKPSVENLRDEANIILNSSSLRTHNDVIDVPNNISGLLDGITTTTYTYGTAMLRKDSGNYIDFSITTGVRIWAIGTKSYSDSGGSTPKDILIKKWNGTSWENYSTRSTKNDGSWYELTGELSIGRYRIEPTANYVLFDEWYIEKLPHKKLTLKNPTTNQNYSLSDKTLISLPNDSSETMINYGIEAGVEIGLDGLFGKINYVKEFDALNTSEGFKVVKHTINTKEVSKIRL